MTNKDALYWCEQFTDNVVISNVKGSKMFLALEAMKQCKNALERQIPKKITHEASLYKCCTCPNCKNVFDRFEKWGESTVRITVKYCPICGQALDWEETNDT